MKKNVFWLIFLVLIIVIFMIGYPRYEMHFAKLEMDQDQVEVYLPSNIGFEEVGQVLISNNIFSKLSDFEKFSRYFDLNENNFEPGKYRFANNQKLKYIIYALKNGNGERKDTKIVFTYSQNIPSMVSKIHNSIEADSSTLVNYILSDSVINRYGFNKETIISLFLPDTYEVGEWDMDEKEFVGFMAKQYRIFWNSERKSKLAALNLSQSEVSTLASIVMSEQSKLEEEWSTISGLYLNRLKKGIKLESDPTFKFCWGDELSGVQRLLYKHRDKDCPYNTYMYKGLPPGPIMLVSKKAIDAVLDFKKHNYIFMCAVGDGSGKHNFAENYRQHLRNAAIYRKNQFGSN